MLSDEVPGQLFECRAGITPVGKLRKWGSWGLRLLSKVSGRRGTGSLLETKPFFFP